jgi:hypothetical protein
MQEFHTQLQGKQSWHESQRYPEKKGGQDDMNDKWEEQGLL